jgi:ribonuclease BN (tRNA processing enzyme)
MRLTVVGSSASYAGPGQACSGYLVASGSTRVLLDCGNGSLANLARVIDPTGLDAIFISHRHPDHFLDLFAMQALVRYAPSGPLPPVTLYAPDGLLDAMACVLDGRGQDDMLAAFEAPPFVAGVAVSVGDLDVTPMPVDHVEDTYALRVRGPRGLLCYTSDSRLGPEVLDATAGADVLLAEATLPQAYAGRAPHMTAAEAGTLAAEIGASKLVLTHLWPTSDREQMLADARTTFAGEIVLAAEMLEVAIP